MKRKLFFSVVLLISIAAYSQKNFTFSPEKPKAGETITVTYEPAGDLASIVLPVEAVVYQQTPKVRKADDLQLKRSNGKFVGSFIADPEVTFIFLKFFVDKTIDNNYNEGYTILLYENGQPVKNTNYGKALFYQSLGTLVGVEINNEKALAALEKEIELYPDNGKTYFYNVTRLQTLVKKEEAPKIIQKAIETFVKGSLKEETDYSTLSNLYLLAKLPEQQKFITALKKEKFPDGAWTVTETLTALSAEKNIEKKKQLLADLIKKAETGGEKWKFVRDNISNYKLQIPNYYITNKDWANVKKAVDESGVTDKALLASVYNNAAWEMQKTSAELAFAEEFARKATEHAKEARTDLNAKKPDGLTQKQWDKNKESMYAMYADTYAMVLYRLGSYKKGYVLAKESAMTINKGISPDQNNTYALLAEKALSKKQYVKELEQFVKDGKSTSEMKDILKRAFVKDKKSETGFDNYIAALEKEAYNKMLEDLRKSMMNETAASFALVDLSGKKVQLADLKGKVVVVDFWATWCGPCKASFPAMQKMVSRYEADPNVKFVFIDTWERGENKPKDAADFITANKYTFHVLMDNEDKVVAEYKVEGIPTKFVIDKTGKLRFKAIGFDGSDDKLVQELTAMIDLASNETDKKAF